MDTESPGSVIDSLGKAWNAGDARAFAGFFTEDADLVNIHGMHLHGRQAIAGLYEMLFRSVFDGSHVKCSIAAERTLRPQVMLLQMKVALSVPAGKMAGSHNALATVVMVREQAHWRIESLHNTLVTAA